MAGFRSISIIYGVCPNSSHLAGGFMLLQKPKGDIFHSIKSQHNHKHILTQKHNEDQLNILATLETLGKHKNKTEDNYIKEKRCDQNYRSNRIYLLVNTR